MPTNQPATRTVPSLGIVVFSAIVGVLGLGSGVLILALQCFIWAKSGVWHAIPATEIMILAGGDLAIWAHRPTDWVGLHAVVAWFPLSVIALVVGFLFMCNADDEYVTRRLALDADRPSE